MYINKHNHAARPATCIYLSRQYNKQTSKFIFLNSKLCFLSSVQDDFRLLYALKQQQ